MKVVYTDQALGSLEEIIDFLVEEGVQLEKIAAIQKKLLDRADSLKDHPFIGQIETYLEHLDKGHRRLVKGNYKIIYRIKGHFIYVTDFFDTRQNPSKLKG